MASEILGLFTSPEMYQQQRDLAMQQQAAQLAQLDPYQNIRYSAIRAGQQFGGGLAGLLGAEDPQLRMISARQSALSGLDLSDPDAIMAAARQLSGVGDQQGAFALAEYGRKAATDKALAEQRARERTSPALLAAARIRELTAGKQKLIDQGAAADSPEIKLIDAEISDIRRGGKGIGAGGGTDAEKNAYALAALKGEPGSEAFNAEYAKQLPLLLAKGGGKIPDVIEIARELASRKGAPGTKEYEDEYTAQLTKLSTKPDKETKPSIKEVGVAVGTNAPVYLDEIAGQQFIFVKDAEGKQIRQPYFGGVDRTTAKVSASVGALGEKAFRQRLGVLDANRVEAAVSTRDNSIAALNSLNRLTSLSDAGLISGPYAGGRTGVVNFLDALGLTSEKDKSTLARSENYQKIAGDIVLATLGGRLGAGFSNEDRKFIQGLVPQLETSAAGRRQLLDFLIKKNQEIIDETTRLEDYARDNDSLKGFKSKIPIPRQSAGSNATAMTDEELKAARARLIGGKK